MAGASPEKLLVRVREQSMPSMTQVFVSWVLSAPVVGPDGISYQSGSDYVNIGITDDSQTIQQKIRDQIAARVSAVTGGTYTAADVRGFQAVRTGTITFGALETSHAVTFSAPMPSAVYKVTAFPRGLNLALNITNQTVTGFTFTFLSGNAGDVDYVAVEDSF